MKSKSSLLPSILSENFKRSKSGSEQLLLQTKWFVQILEWIQRPRHKEEKNFKVDTLYTTRIKYLLQVLRANEEWKNHFVTTVKAILLEMTLPTQLATAGLSKNRSFQQELTNRIQDKLLPALPPSFGLEDLIVETFPSEDESILIDSIDLDVLKELFDFFSGDIAFKRSVLKNVVTAAHHLSLEYLTLVLQILGQMGQEPRSLTHLCEFQLEDSLRAMVLAESTPQNQVTKLLAICVQAEYHLLNLEEKMKTSAVKIDWVYDVKIQRRRLDRMISLIGFLRQDQNLEAQIRFFIARLIIDSHHQKSLRSFLSENFTLLTQKVMQSNSIQGEHYVTYNWNEFKKMFKSAAGAGGITSLTVIAKNLISSVRLDGFLKGLADSFNYSLSFLIIQLLGFTLATKQPSGTAPFIAQVLKTSVRVSRLSIIALLRTQFIAVLGNLLLVFPISLAVSWILMYIGFPLFNESEAYYAFHSSDLISFSPIFASLTGVILFLGGIIAGWFENFCHVNQMEQRLRNSKFLLRVLGLKRTEVLASFIYQNSNALAANFSLGFLLGMTPKYSHFFSIPFEVKHVTLATGQFAASLPLLVNNPLINGFDLANAILGLLAIGVLNISVSFFLAFMLASVSSEVSVKLLLKHLGWGMRLILTRPWLLFVPQEKEKAGEEK